MSARYPRHRERGDPDEALWAGVQLSAVLGGIAGTISVGTFFGWIWLTASLGVFDPEEREVVASAAWFASLWIAVSVALLAGLWLSYSAWERRMASGERRAALREQRDAVAAAEALLEAARSQPSSGSGAPSDDSRG